jgi:hypothetical protein
MHRSGSTLVWQVTRQLLDGRPGLRNPHGVPSSDFPAAAADPDDLLLAKIHYRHGLPEDDFPQEGAYYLYTYRDVRDVVASLFRKARLKEDSPRRGPATSRTIARREIHGDGFWLQRGSVWAGRYEEIQGDLPGLVRSLAAFLHVDVTDERVAEIAEFVTLEQQQERVWQWRNEGVDPDLRVTANHITDGRAGAWRDTLTTDELEAIEDLSARWLVERDYPVETPLGLRKTARLRKERRHARSTPSALPQPVQLPTEPRRRSRQRWATPLLVAAAILALLGILAAFTVPAASPLPWILALGCAAAGGYLRGRRGRALAPPWRR